jgi:hypothetical protein
LRSPGHPIRWERLCEAVEVEALDLLSVRLDASDPRGVRTEIEKEIVKP